MKFTSLDWFVLVITLCVFILYGIYRSRTSRNLEGYFLSDRQLPWWMIMLGVMGTQASAVTFLTAPGQAYTDGMRFLQYYFGLPLAMVILCISFVPLFHRLKVFTAYEFLEKRFDKKTRLLTSFLFLLSRGLSTGISVIAPSIVLHSMLGWDFYLTNFAMGGLLVIYTTTGGAKAVAYTQKWQFMIIYAAMFLAGWYAIKGLPENISWTEALHIGGKSGKLNVITTGFESGTFDWKDKYNIISGLLGGLFLSLSYFGTDQSQVGRYLTARSASESRWGLLLNGIVKVPLQFFILLIGVFIFSFYQFTAAPVYFNKEVEGRLRSGPFAGEYQALAVKYDSLQVLKRRQADALQNALEEKNAAAVASIRTAVLEKEQQAVSVRRSVKELVKKAEPGSDGNDANYIFLRFVGDFLPSGIVGLIIAIIFLAAWGSIAAALNSLASCTMIDFHKQFARKELSEEAAYRWSKFYTVLWGVFCILTALFAYNLGNSLIEAVNILGSWFYGTILGIFLAAFYLKRVKGDAVFFAALVSEALVIYIYYLDVISFLWLNVIGASAVVLLSLLIQYLPGKKKPLLSQGP